MRWERETERDRKKDRERGGGRVGEKNIKSERFRLVEFSILEGTWTNAREVEPPIGNG